VRDVSSSSLRLVGVLSSWLVASGGFVPPVFDPVVFVCCFFPLFCCCLLVQIEDFLVQIRDKRRVLVVSAEVLPKPDLQNSAGISLTRIFLLRSPAFPGHGGHSASPCGALLFGA
jgi:hypothetical protein